MSGRHGQQLSAVEEFEKRSGKHSRLELLGPHLFPPFNKTISLGEAGTIKGRASRTDLQAHIPQFSLHHPGTHPEVA